MGPHSHNLMVPDTMEPQSYNNFYIITNFFRNSKLSQFWKPWLHCAWCSSCLRQNCTLCASVVAYRKLLKTRIKVKIIFYELCQSLTISWLLNHFFSRGHLPVLGVGVLEQANHWGPHLPLGLPALPHIRFWKSKVLVCEDFRSHPHAQFHIFTRTRTSSMCKVSNTFAHSHFRTYISAPDRTQAFAPALVRMHYSVCES